MTDPLSQRLPRVIGYNANDAGVIDRPHIRRHLTSMGYDLADVDRALSECVDAGVVEQVDGGYRLPDGVDVWDFYDDNGDATPDSDATPAPDEAGRRDA